MPYSWADLRDGRVDLSRVGERRWLGSSLTRDPADAPPTSEYHHDFGPMRARCSGCRRLSVPRPSGVTPVGWSRDEDGQGAYWCETCTAWRADA